MPIMINLRRVIIFAGERGEGLQKTHKLAFFADELVVIPETTSTATEIIVPAGQSPLLHETLLLPAERHIPLYQLCASELNDSNNSELLNNLIHGASFVCSDLSDRAINERIASIAALHGVPCNIIDTRDLCSAWFMSLIHTPHISVAVSSNGSAAWYASRLRSEIEPLVHSREPLAATLATLRTELVVSNRMQGLALVYDNRRFRKLITRAPDKALEYARTLLRKKGLL